MKTHKTNFLDWNNKILTDSLKKIDLNFFLIIFLDMLFYISTIFALAFWLKRANEKMASFDFSSISVQLLKDEMNFYFILLLSLVVLLIAIIFMASILNGIIWAKTTKTKVTLKLISKFLALNLVWMGFWFILIFVIAYIVQQEAVPYFIGITALIGLYLSNNLYTIFMGKQAMKSIPYSLKLSFSKIHLFLLPYAVIFLLLFILIYLGNIIIFPYSPIIFGLLAVIYLGIARYYASALAYEIEKI